MRTLTIPVLAVCLFTLTSCAWDVGRTHVNLPTVGQELIDLKTALAKGALTQEEYDAKKKEFLKEKRRKE